MTFFRNLRQSYADLRLQTKFTLVLLLIVAIPGLIVTIFFYTRLYEMVTSYTISQEQDASARTAPMIETIVEKVVDTCDALTDYNFYGTLFYQPLNEPVEEACTSSEAQEFQAAVESLSDGNPVSGIRIYTELPTEDNALYTSEYTRDIFAPVSQARGTYWYGILRGNHATELYCPTFYLGVKERAEYGDMAYIRTASIYYEGQSYPVYIVIYYNNSGIEQILSENLTLDGSVSYIINERDNLVASSSDALSSIYWLNYESIASSFMSSNNFIERTILNETVYAGFYNISQSGWFMVTVLPSTPLVRQSNLLMLEFGLIYLAVLVLAFLLASVLSHSITKRLSSVISQMNTVREGPPVPMDSPVSHDEVGNLIDTYNYMARQINDLLKEQAEAAEDLRNAEFNSLQAQINPHFLYNTMDMINWMAQQGHTSEISKAVQDLSRFYKLTLSKKQSISTIANDVEHSTIYVRLQNMRYHDSILLITDIPDELMEYKIPRLTLQPVIENAILHGILEKESKSGTIVLTGWLEDEDVVLLVSDDGVGMTKETLDNLLYGTGKSSSGGTNIAIYNTHRRLQILYGDHYGLHYSSEPGQGTEVQIRIPAQK